MTEQNLNECSTFYSNLSAVFSQMEGSDFTWSEILKDSEYSRFAEEFPNIYTNHWLHNGEERFKKFQLPYMECHVTKIAEKLELKKDDVFIDLTDNDHTIAKAVRDKVMVSKPI